MCWLTQVDLDKRPFNGCRVTVVLAKILTGKSIPEMAYFVSGETLSINSISQPAKVDFGVVQML